MIRQDASCHLYYPCTTSMKTITKLQRWHRHANRAHAYTEQLNTISITPNTSNVTYTSHQNRVTPSLFTQSISAQLPHLQSQNIVSWKRIDINGAIVWLPSLQYKQIHRKFMWHSINQTVKIPDRQKNYYQDICFWKSSSFFNKISFQNIYIPSRTGYLRLSLLKFNMQFVTHSSLEMVYN